jgi:hypothetical protein
MVMSLLLPADVMLGERVAAMETEGVLEEDSATVVGAGVAPHLPKTQPMRLLRPPEEVEVDDLLGWRRSVAMPLRRLWLDPNEEEDFDSIAGRAACAVASLSTAWVVKERDTADV